tara:strand:+ start:743 stop:1165 length:423 start_codon:yes stop_codon:yes gene_type:complete
MASTGLMNGSLLVLQISTDGNTFTNLGHSQSSSMSFTLDTPEATSKDSGGYTEVIAGARSITINFDSFVAYDDTVDVDTMIGHANNRTKIHARFGTAVSGDTTYAVQGFISSIDYTADAEAPITFSGTFTSTGAVSIGTN